MVTAELELERLGLVPTHVREYVLERDSVENVVLCRVCGRATESPALHHVVFRSQGGLDVPSNLISIGWEPGHDCHLEIAHGPDARMWREIFLAIADRPALTALQVSRWRGTRAPRRGQ